METCFNYCDKVMAFFSSDELRWINRIRKLKEEYPEEVRVIRYPETNDGCIYVELPARWLKVQPPRKLNLSEEDAQKRREWMLHLTEQQRIEREKK